MDTLKTPKQISRDEQNERIAARYRELRNIYPTARPWTLVSKIAEEDVAIKTSHYSAAHIRRILQDKGEYPCLD